MCCYRAGIVSKQMLHTPKQTFFVIGALEAASQILGFIGAAKLPGVCQHQAKHWCQTVQIP